MNRQQQRSIEPQPKGLWWKFCYTTWFPFKSVRSVIILSSVLGLCFIGLAITQLIFFLSSTEIQSDYSYSLKCIHTNGTEGCIQNILIRETLNPPIVLAYYIQNAYINHRRYLNSMSLKQLQGQTIDMDEAKKFCQPYITNKQMQKNISYTGSTLEPHQIASPCGYVSKLMFNDTFSLFNSQGEKIQIDQTNLYQNPNGQFKKSSDSQSTQWIDPQNNHLMVWMKNSVLIKKYKLWGIIHTKLEFGKYNLVVKNNYRIGEMPITKGVYIGNPSKFGSPEYLLPILFFIMGILCFAYVIFMKLMLPQYDSLVQQNKLLQKKQSK